MARAYECIVHPDFYRQIGVDISKEIEQGKAIVKEYVESTRRKNTMMKWDVKHDKAKRVIDAFLESAANWHRTGEVSAPKRVDLEGDLTDEEKNLVYEEMMLMITSIRKRYKLQERLPVLGAQIQSEEVGAVIPAESAKEMLSEPVSEDKGNEKTKRTKAAGEKKTPSRRKKKEIQEEEQA